MQRTHSLHAGVVPEGRLQQEWPLAMCSELDEVIDCHVLYGVWSTASNPIHPARSHACHTYTLSPYPPTATYACLWPVRTPYSAIFHTCSDGPSTPYRVNGRPSAHLSYKVQPEHALSGSSGCNGNAPDGRLPAPFSTLHGVRCTEYGVRSCTYLDSIASRLSYSN